ncbi:MAG: HAD family hydrolase [Planctomycetaceae bacterium]|nr:HAD family hydrolase [Planctomycetaceae bacterium]
MTAKPQIAAAVFDLDDTLYAERDYVAGGYRAVAEHLQNSLGRCEDFAAWLWQRFVSGQSAKAFDAMNEHFRLNFDAAQLARLVKIYREHRPVIRPLEGMAELLQSLRSRGVRLAILSDGFLPAQQYKLDALKLAGLMDAVIFTESLGREFWKPCPAAFEAIAAKLALPHSSCVYIADNPAKDFVAPNALGWGTIQFRFDGQLHANNPPAPAGAPQATACGLANLAAIIC